MTVANPQGNGHPHTARPPVRRQHQRRAARRRTTAGVVAMAGVLIAAYGAFGPGLPFSNQFELRGVFSTANELQPGSDVRMGGLSIGSVDNVESGKGRTAVVTMRIDEHTVPIRSDARLSIEPRLALEGNYYIDVSPGAPSAPILASGSTIPRTHTSGPVQIDQLVNVFDAPVRSELASSIAQLARGLGPSATPSVTNRSSAGYNGLRRATDALDRALASVRQISRASQGTQPGDLTRALASTGDLTAQLGGQPARLAGLVAGFDGTFNALAATDSDLSASIRQLDDVLRVAPAQLTSIDAALPGLTRFAVALRPALRQAPATLTEATPFLAQVGRLVQRPELPALLTNLEPVTANLSTLETRLDALFPYLTLAMGCVSRNVVPTLDKSVQDGPNTDGQSIWQELLHTGASLASAASDFDANGTTVRLGVNESETTLEADLPNFGALYTNAKIEGVHPTSLGPGALPPFHPDQWCIQQQLPNLDNRYGAAPSIFQRSSPALGSKEQPHLAALRAAILTRKPSAVVQALVPLLKLLGWPTTAIDKQLSALGLRVPWATKLLGLQSQVASARSPLAGLTAHHGAPAKAPTPAPRGLLSMPPGSGSSTAGSGRSNSSSSGSGSSSSGAGANLSSQLGSGLNHLLSGVLGAATHTGTTGPSGTTGTSGSSAGGSGAGLAGPLGYLLGK